MAWSVDGPQDDHARPELDAGPGHRHAGCDGDGQRNRAPTRSRSGPARSTSKSSRPSLDRERAAGRAASSSDLVSAILRMASRRSASVDCSGGAQVSKQLEFEEIGDELGSGQARPPVGAVQRHARGGRRRQCGLRAGHRRRAHGGRRERRRGASPGAGHDLQERRGRAAARGWQGPVFEPTRTPRSASPSCGPSRALSNRSRSTSPGPTWERTRPAWPGCKTRIGRAVGLPRVVGGIPLDELGATGFGLARCAEVAAAARERRARRGPRRGRGFRERWPARSPLPGTTWSQAGRRQRFAWGGIRPCRHPGGGPSAPPSSRPESLPATAMPSRSTRLTSSACPVTS